MADNEDLFRFNRGRFLVDDEANQAKRYVRFDVGALGRVAAAAVGAARCVRTEKLYQGLHNKILLLTMDEGTEVITKIPQPNAGPVPRTVASEVATTEFVREVLETPVPKVYAWSASANNEVGAAYILMEKCRGVRLTNQWPAMNVGQRTAAMMALAQVQGRWGSVTFAKYGSLYFASDLSAELSGGELYKDRDGRSIENDKYAIGPCTSRLNFREGRGAVEFYRGPWNSAQAYMEGLGLQEIKCVNHAAKFPTPSTMVYGPGTYIPTKEKKLRALYCYMELVGHLMPDVELCGAALWNPWIKSVFVDPDNPGTITGILDWQAIELGPLFAQVFLPDMAAHEAPSSEAPTVPNIYQSQGQQQAPGMDQAAIMNMVRNMLDATYRMTVGNLSSRPVVRASEFQKSEAHFLLFQGAVMFNYGEAVFAHLIMNLRQNWSTLATSGQPYPFTFTAQEEQEIVTDFVDCRRAVVAMQRVQSMMGSIEHSPLINFMVSPGQYVQAKALTQSLKQFWMQQLETERIINTEEQRREAEAWWPFDD